MNELNVLALSGSLRTTSYNTAMLRAARTLSPAGLAIDIHPGLGRLPLYDTDPHSAELLRELLGALARKVGRTLVDCLEQT